MNELKSGFLNINKPIGPTSFDIIAKLRKITGIKKIGHAGTLDPLASGVLLVAVGRDATRRIDEFIKMDKEYIATLYLGATTETFDGESEAVKINCTAPSLEKVKKILISFIGEQKQVPPMFSAKKIKGKKLYELARQGVEVEREAVDINICDIELLNYQWPILKIKTKVSSGVYIRSLASDIGKALGCGAYLSDLERTSVGGFKIEDSVRLKDLEKKDLSCFDEFFL